MKKNRLRIYVCLLIVAIGLMSYTGFNLFQRSQDEKSTVSFYSNIALATKIDTGTATKSAQPLSAVRDEESLLAQNSDYVGWIRSDNGSIDYPVVQTDDNLTYLKTRFDGVRSAYGTIFADCSCDLGTAHNIILYGHNESLSSGKMFSSLHNYYNDQTYIEKYPSIEFVLKGDENSSGVWDIFSVIRADISTQKNADLYYRNVSDDGYADYLSFLQKESSYQIDVPVSTGQRVLILSTCFPNRQYNYRLLICAIERIEN